MSKAEIEVIRDRREIERVMGRLDYDCPRCGERQGHITAVYPSMVPVFELHCDHCGHRFHSR